MEGILFALIAIGAVCIDLVLNRGLVEEINDEAKKHKKNLETTFAAIELPRIRKNYKASRDKAEALINKLLNKVKDGCASKNAQPFYYTIFTISVVLILFLAIDKGYANFNNNLRLYQFLGAIGIDHLALMVINEVIRGIVNVVWPATFIFYIYRIFKVIRYRCEIDQDRKNIRAKVKNTIITAKTMAGDPSFHLDE